MGSNTHVATYIIGAILVGLAAFQEYERRKHARERLEAPVRKDEEHK